MKMLITILTILFTTLVLAAGSSSPTKFPTDVLQFGHYGSTNNHNLVFDFQLSTNPMVSVDSSTKTFNYNFNNVEFGDGTTGTDKNITANIGGSNPQLKYSVANSQWQFSNDGTNFTAIGSGSGGAGINLLQNPGFESGTNLWTVSGLTASVVTSGSNLLFDKKSVTLVASASGQYFEQSVAVPNGLASTPCAVSVWYLGGDTNMVLHFTDGSNNDLGPSLALAPTTYPQQVFVNGNCPASGSNAKIRFVSLSSTSLVSIDDASLGNATNLSQVSQAQWLGRISFPAACSWSQSTGSTFTNFPATTGCTPTVTGKIQAPSTLIPGFVIPSYGPGNYQIVGTGFFYGTNAPNTNAYYQYSDGTNVSGSGFLNSGGVANIGIGIPNFTASINNTTPSSNVTIQVQSAGNASISDTDSPTTFDVYYFPSQTQTVQSSLCLGTGTCVNHLIASIGTSQNILSQNVPWLASCSTSPADVSCVFTPGLLTTAPNCIVSMSLAAGANQYIAVNSVSTTGFTIAYLLNGSHVSNYPFTISCDKQGADISATAGAVKIGGVTTSLQGIARHEWASVGFSCSSSPCTILNQSGGISSITRASTGLYTANFSPVFSGTPTCMIIPQDPTAGASLIDVVISQTSSALTFQTLTGNTASVYDAGFNIFCDGPQ